MPKTLDITRILRKQKKQLRAGFQDRLVMTASIFLRMFVFSYCLPCGKTNGFQDSCPSENIGRLARSLSLTSDAPCFR